MANLAPTLNNLFVGSGEMAERCRAYDWAATPLGPPETWSQSLRTMADAVIASRNPMLLFWGPDLVQFYNDAFRPSIGARHPRALGMRAPDFWTDVWSVVGPMIERVMTIGESVWFEDMYLPIDRGEGVRTDAWWTYSYSPVRDDDGRINGTMVVCLETTPSVLSRSALEFERARLTGLFKHAPAFMCVLRGPQHVYEYANDNYQRMVGYRELIGRPVAEALPEIKDQGFFDLLDNVLQTGEPFIGNAVPVRVQNREGHLEELYLNFVYQPITESDGSRSGVFVHGVDVTESVRTRAQAEAANRAKSEFLAVMSHELRTPLNAIDGYAELLELGVHGPLTDKQRDDVARIRRSERHLLGLINDVLNYTHIEAGAVRYVLEDVVLADVVATCDALTAPQRRAKGLHCDMICPHDITVRADEEKLQQILLNLLTNAIKFTPEGGSIATGCATHHHTAVITVSDTGRGIPADQLEHIFEPFVQVDSRLTRAQEGVGLGLAISRDLARGMNGDLTVVSSPGKGSTFTLTLPLPAPL